MTERNSAPMGFGPYIRSLREASGLKQRQVAERIGMSQSQYSGIELKAHIGYLPAPEIVTALAQVFGVTEASLIQASGYLRDLDAPAAERPREAALPADVVRRVITNLKSFDEVLLEALDEAREMRDELEAAERQPTLPTLAPSRRRAVG